MRFMTDSYGRQYRDGGLGWTPLGQGPATLPPGYGPVPVPPGPGPTPGEIPPEKILNFVALYFRGRADYRLIPPAMRPQVVGFVNALSDRVHRGQFPILRADEARYWYGKLMQLYAYTPRGGPGATV